LLAVQGSVMPAMMHITPARGQLPEKTIAASIFLIIDMIG
jgi:hypothetical protein